MTILGLLQSHSKYCVLNGICLAIEIMTIKLMMIIYKYLGLLMAVSTLLSSLGLVIIVSDSRVKDQSCDVLLGHARKLVGEHTLQPEHPEEMVWRGRGRQRVVQNLEPNDPLLLLLFCSVVTWYLIIEEPCLKTRQRRREEDELWKQNGKSVSLTSGPTMDRGSVMVATMSLATSIASWPTQNTRWKHTHCHFKPHTPVLWMTQQHNELVS